MAPVGVLQSTAGTGGIARRLNVLLCSRVGQRASGIFRWLFKSMRRGKGRFILLSSSTVRRATSRGKSKTRMGGREPFVALHAHVC